MSKIKDNDHCLSRKPLIDESSEGKGKETKVPPPNTPLQTSEAVSCALHFYTTQVELFKGLLADKQVIQELAQSAREKVSQKQNLQKTASQAEAAG